MTEQLNERDMWLLNRGYDYGLYDGRNDSEGSEDNGWDRFVLEKLAESAPVNPNSARITELEAEVERLNGLLDEVEGAFNGVEMNDRCRACDELNDEYQQIRVRVVDARRTAERKEPTDASD